MGDINFALNKSGTQNNIVIPSDTPFVTPALYRYLISHAGSFDVIVPASTLKVGRNDITITNINGKHIANRKSKGQIETFDLKSYANGIYLVTIRHKEEIYNLKVIKD